MYPSRDVTFITAIMNSFVLYVNWSIEGAREGGREGGRKRGRQRREEENTWKLLDLHKSKQGNTTNLNISSSVEKEKRAAQVGLEPTTYCLLGRCSIYMYH